MVSSDILVLDSHLCYCLKSWNVPKCEGGLEINLQYPGLNLRLHPL